MTKYKNNLITVGGGWEYSEEFSEIMKRTKNGNFHWSILEPGEFYRVSNIFGHSLVTVPPSDINEEHVLLIGNFENEISNVVFKFNGTWSYFGKLNKPRMNHNSIYWNGAVYVIGGMHGNLNDRDFETKMEIWKIEDSPNEFKTSKNWPELNFWLKPHLFIVSDSFFPDY